MTLQEFINFAVASTSWTDTDEKIALQVRKEYPGLIVLGFIVPHLYLKLGSENLLNLVRITKRCTGLGLKECKDAVVAHHQKNLAILEEMKIK